MDQGKCEYVHLLTETTVRDAIRTAIEVTELEDEAEHGDGYSDEYFTTSIKPICIGIADSGEWPQGCSFMCYDGLTEILKFDGFLLRLFVGTPDKECEGYALPIVQVLYGR